MVLLIFVFRMDYIFSLYGCVFLLGVLGNVIIGVSLTSGTGGRNRNPLLLGLVTADFLVCCLSAPVTAVLYAISSITYTWSRTAVFFQVKIPPTFFLNIHSVLFPVLARIGEHAFDDGDLNRQISYGQKLPTCWSSGSTPAASAINRRNHLDIGGGSLGFAIF